MNIWWGIWERFSILPPSHSNIFQLPHFSHRSWHLYRLRHRNRERRARSQRWKHHLAADCKTSSKRIMDLGLTIAISTGKTMDNHDKLMKSELELSAPKVSPSSRAMDFNVTGCIPAAKTSVARTSWEAHGFVSKFQGLQFRSWVRIPPLSMRKTTERYKNQPSFSTV